MEWIDLRSDTVTHPTPAMRQAMAEAEVGDDVYGDDPTVNRLEELASELMGKEAAIFVPSGTMGNLAAVIAHCQRGDEAILGDQAHQFIYEAGGMAALAGVQPRTVPNLADGRLPIEQVERAIRPDDPHHPRTRLICFENTHNLCRGEVLSVEHGDDLREVADANGLLLHLDGARIFNAACALGVPAVELAAPADSVTFCLSKALCAPVGSVLCGAADFIQRAHRARKILGGGMRQAGVLAAAGLIALQEMTDRLGEDHQRAQHLAHGLVEIPGVEVDNPVPASNMVYIRLAASAGLDAAQLSRRAAESGIRLTPRGERAMRLVTHYWIDDEAVSHVLNFFQQAL